MNARQDLARTGGREAQRARTRRAIVDAARQLVAEGAPTTVDAVAEAAQVSRRTVYLHFPSLDQLLLDAALGALSEAHVDGVLDVAAGPSSGGDVYARVEALVRAVLELAPVTLPLGRQIIRLTVDQARTGSSDDEASTARRRGDRRTRWIESALSPIAELVTAEQHDRLVSGLTMLIGFEAMVVLRDVRGASTERERDVTLWAARALIDATLAEAREAGPAPEQP